MTNTGITLITNGNLFAFIVARKMLRKFRNEIKCVIIIEGDYSGNSKYKGIIKIFSSTTLPYFIYKIWTVFISKIVERKYPHAGFRKFCIENNIPLLKSNKVNNPDLICKVSQYNANLLISIGCPQLIKKPWFEIFPDHRLNIHASLLPAYAGLAPYFWVLANNEKRTGITVHRMESRFDNGNIIDQSSMSINRGESAFALFLKLCNVGSENLVSSIEKIRSGERGVTQDLSFRSYFSHPKWKNYLDLRSNGFRLFKFRDIRLLRNVICDNYKVEEIL